MYTVATVLAEKPQLGSLDLWIIGIYMLLLLGLGLSGLALRRRL